MRLESVTIRSFRNLADATLELPTGGVALLGPNGQGKTNFLEALAYPVLFRSLRGSRDKDLGRFGGPGFHVGLVRASDGEISATWDSQSKRKHVTVNGHEQSRITDALGAWLAVTFLPTDLALVQGGASERRRWLDRMLSLGKPAYLEALLRYRAAVAQRNAALRKGDLASAGAFDIILATSGATVVQGRLDWLSGAENRWQEELGSLGEPLDVGMRYRGDVELADESAWPDRLKDSAERDQLRGQTHVGPHRDDLFLGLDGRALREFGSTGQQRTAAIGLRMVEHTTLCDHAGIIPALLVDDIFAELDDRRQAKLAARLQRAGAQLVVTAPRQEDLPADLEAPRWYVDDGTIRSA